MEQVRASGRSLYLLIIIHMENVTETVAMCTLVECKPIEEHL